MISRIIQADVTAWLRGNQWLAQNGFLPRYHAVLADPPYGLAFMGQRWDTMTPVQYQAWVTEWATLLLDFVYPGAVLAMFGGTRTYHRLAAGLEDAGWDVFDSMVWLYGSGFPKSHDVSKAIDREAGAERVRIRGVRSGVVRGTYAQDAWSLEHKDSVLDSTPLTPDAARWHGFGTALKPAFEPIVLARAPRGAHTYAALARTYGSGALAIDAGRVEAGEDYANAGWGERRGASSMPHMGGHQSRPFVLERIEQGAAVKTSVPSPAGRWPANVLLDDHAAAALDAQSGVREGGRFVQVQRERNKGWVNPSPGPGVIAIDNYGDSGGASRFFYTAKAAAWEREAGLSEGRMQQLRTNYDKSARDAHGNDSGHPRRNAHPTVKPIQLTEYLARLLLPPELDTPRRLLVPFSGSGSEMIGAALAGWDVATGVEREAEYVEIARARLAWWAQFGSYEDAHKAYQAARKEARKVEQAGPIIAQIPLFEVSEAAR